MTLSPRPEPILVAILQTGRLGREAAVLAASLRASGSRLRLILAEPAPGPLWSFDPRLPPGPLRDFLAARAEFLAFPCRLFGEAYPQGNKIEALAHLPDRHFIFLDTDTLVLADPAGVPIDFARPTASLRRTATWPKPLPGWPGHRRVWDALYRRFGLDLARHEDRTRDPGDWQRYPYYNAGWFFGQSPRVFGAAFAEIAAAIRDDPPPELAGQKLYPWLDQIALPLVIARLGGGPGLLPPGLFDGSVTNHYRELALLYARDGAASVELLDRLRPDLDGVLGDWPPWRALVIAGQGRAIRAEFASLRGAEDEVLFRKPLKARGLWFR